MRNNVRFLALVLCSVALGRADQLVTNGGFETGDLSAWTATGSVTSSPFASDFYGVDTADAASGTYGAYLGSELSQLSLSQSLTVKPAYYYTVSFSLAQTSNLISGFANSFSASFNGFTFFSEANVPASAFGSYTFTLSTAPSAATTAALSFISRNDLGYFSLDNVSVSTGTATPEPATLLLIAPVLGAAALLRRRLNRA